VTKSDNAWSPTSPRILDDDEEDEDDDDDPDPDDDDDDEDEDDEEEGDEETWQVSAPIPVR
jgi:hypothetical protein